VKKGKKSQGTFGEHSGKVCGTFREHSWNIQWTFREIQLALKYEHRVQNIGTGVVACLNLIVVVCAHSTLVVCWTHSAYAHVYLQRRTTYDGGIQRCHLPGSQMSNRFE
jgi:hypothetical protein